VVMRLRLPMSEGSSRFTRWGWVGKVILCGLLSLEGHGNIPNTATSHHH